MHYDDEFTEPVLASPYRLALREEALPGHLSPAAVRLHRQVRRRVRELELASRMTTDRHAALELGRAAASVRDLLACHFPFASARCPTCRTRLGRLAPWPCHVWRIAHTLLGN